MQFVEDTINEVNNAEIFWHSKEMRNEYVQKIITAIEGANIKIARTALKQAFCKLEKNSFVTAQTNSG